MNPSPYIELRFYFQDDDGASSRHTVFLLLAHLNEAPAFAVAYADLVGRISDSVLVRINMIITYLDQSSPRGVGSDLHRVGVFSFDTDNTPPGLFVITVPGVKDAVLLATGPLAGVAIDPEQSDVAAFVAATTNGTIRPVAPWDSGGSAGAGDDYSVGAYLISLHSGYVGEVP